VKATNRVHTIAAAGSLCTYGTDITQRQNAYRPKFTYISTPLPSVLLPIGRLAIRLTRLLIICLIKLVRFYFTKYAHLDVGYMRFATCNHVYRTEVRQRAYTFVLLLPQP